MIEWKRKSKQPAARGETAMSRRRIKTVNERRRKFRASEEMRQFLLREPEEIDFSNDAFIQKLLAPFADFPVEVTRRWAEEWREEHRRSR